MKFCPPRGCDLITAICDSSEKFAHTDSVGQFSFISWLLDQGKTKKILPSLIYFGSE